MDSLWTHYGHTMDTHRTNMQFYQIRHKEEGFPKNRKAFFFIEKIKIIWSKTKIVQICTFYKNLSQQYIE